MLRFGFWKKMALIAVIAALGLLCLGVVSAETCSGQCGDDVYWSLDTETGVLEISGNGGMYDYNRGSPRWNSDHELITSIVIRDGVTSIGNWAFSHCSNLSNVDIPNSVMTIGNSAFYLSNRLSDINVTSFEQWLRYDHNDSCLRGNLHINGELVTSLIIPDDVTAIGDCLFRNCTCLKNIVIPDSVKSIGDRAFQNCSGLTIVTIPDSVTSIGELAFYDCTNIVNLTISKNITNIDRGAFWGCSSLTSIDLPCNLNTIDEYVFCGCTSLTSLEIPDSVTSIGQCVFAECANLKNIVIPNGVTSIGNYAFDGCSSLTNLILPEKLTTIGYGTFSRCASLTDVVIPESVTLIDTYAFCQCTSLTSVVIPDGVTSIGDYAFDSCSSLSSVIIPEGLKTIGTYAFSWCTSLKSISIPESLTSVGSYAFEGCPFTSITISSIEQWLNTDFGLSLSKNGNLYVKGEKLINVNIPDDMTAIRNFAFSNCSDLISVSIPSSVTNIGNAAFNNCKSLTNIYYNGDFSDRSKMTIGSSNNYLLNATWHCRQNGTCGENLTWSIDDAGLLTIAGTGAMTTYTKDSVKPWGTSLVKAVVVKDGVSSLSPYAFYGSPLEKIYLPDSLTTFGTELLTSTPTVYCCEYSKADEWATTSKLPVVYTDNRSFPEYGTVSLLQDTTLFVGKTTQLTVSLFPILSEQERESLIPRYTTSNESVAAVDESGLVTALSRGTAVITVDVSGVQDSVTITVQDFSDIGKLTLSNVPQSLQVGTTAQLTVTPDPEYEGLSYAWSSSDAAVLTVSDTGLVTAVGTGSAAITVSAQGVTASTAPIQAYIPITSLSLRGEAWAVAKTATQLVYSYEPANANPSLTWSAVHSAQGQVTITADGELSCNVPGDVTLTLTDQITGLTAQGVVHIVTPVKTVTLPEKLEVALCSPDSYSLEASVTTQRGDALINQLVTFLSSNEAILTVDQNGLLTLKGAGTATVTATAANGICASCAISISEHRLSRIPPTPSDCTHPGNSEYHLCQDCGKYFVLQGEKPVEIQEGAWVLPLQPIHHLEHGLCRDCGQSFSLEGLSKLSLPGNLTKIEAEAFSGINTQVILLPQGCTEIADNAFAGIQSLSYLVIPSGLENQLNLQNILGELSPVILYQ